MSLAFSNTQGRIQEAQLYTNPTLSDLIQRVYHRLKEKSSVSRNHAGVVVKYEDLDFDLPCDFTNCFVFPMDSEEAREAFEERVRAEKKERERKQMEWRKEGEKIRLASMRKQGGGDAEVEDVDGETEEPAPTSTTGGNGVTANTPFVPLCPRFKQPIAVSKLGERPTERVDRPPPALYERLVWEDESKTEVHRRQSRVERWWHQSQTRSAVRVQKVKDLRLCLRSIR
jgi:hypothetical protein